MMNIAVFVSGGGTNLQALIDAQDRGEIKNGKIRCTLPGVSAAGGGCQAYFKVRSYVKDSGCQQQNSLYSKPKRLY